MSEVNKRTRLLFLNSDLDLIGMMWRNTDLKR